LSGKVPVLNKGAFNVQPKCKVLTRAVLGSFEEYYLKTHEYVHKKECPNESHKNN
jgi:hypothetical protein